MSPLKPVPVLIALGVVAQLFGSVVDADDEAALEALREQIKSLERRLSEKRGQRDQTSRELGRVERQIGDASQGLAELTARRERLEARQGELASRLALQGSKLDSQRAALGKQLRTSYFAGRQENVRLILSQDSPARLGRMIVYHDYLNRARSDRIESFRSELRELAGLQTENQELVVQAKSLEESQQTALAKLESARGERRTVLATLTKELSAGGTELKSLQAQEQELAELVLELQALLQDLPADSESSFSQVRGQLFWPVDGRIVRNFGQAKPGNMTWNGVLVRAERGDTVRALYHGRIMFADWLAGMGLLVVIDHGEGYMSLYGHNEAVLKEPGDWVVPGERIALVGDSGGQQEPGLYLEIRQDGVPQNPARWIGKNQR